MEGACSDDLPSRNGWLAVTSATRPAIAATAAFLIARVSGLPEAYWATIMTLVIMQSTLGATLRISGERFIGTLLGAVAGGLLARYFPQSWWVFVFALGVFLLGILCALFRLQNSDRFAGITLAIVMLITAQRAAVDRRTAPVHRGVDRNHRWTCCDRNLARFCRPTSLRSIRLDPRAGPDHAELRPCLMAGRRGGKLDEVDARP